MPSRRAALGYFAPGTHRVVERRGLRGVIAAPTRARLAADRGGDRAVAAPRSRRSRSSRTCDGDRRLLRATAVERAARRPRGSANALASRFDGRPSWCPPRGPCSTRGRARARRSPSGPRTSRSRSDSSSRRNRFLVGPALRRRAAEAAGGASRQRRSTRSAGSGSSRERCSTPGTASTSVEADVGAAADARRTRDSWRGRRAMGDRGAADDAASSRRTTGASTCVVADPPRAGLGAGLAARARPPRRARGSCTSPAIRPRWRGICPPFSPRAWRSAAPGSTTSSPSRIAWRRSSPSSARRDPAGPRRGRGAGGPSGDRPGRRGSFSAHGPCAARARRVLLLGRLRRRASSRSSAARRARPGAPSRLRRVLARGGIRLRAPCASRSRPSRRGPPSAPRPCARPAAVRLEGVLDRLLERTSSAARARRSAADRLEIAGSALEPFRAEVAVFSRESGGRRSVADRGDRVRVTGQLEPEDLPASERELPLPWPRYRLSVKSARLVERRGATLASLLTGAEPAPVRRAARGTAGPSTTATSAGPLAALLLGRTSELDRGMVARYRRGGLYHLLVVSGLHVVLAAGLVRVRSSRSPGVEGKRRDVVLLLAASSSSFSSEAPIRRPSARVSSSAIFLVTRLLERPITAAQAIGLSALVLFLAAPAQIFSVGTILTFAAVLRDRDLRRADPGAASATAGVALRGARRRARGASARRRRSSSGGSTSWRPARG